MIADGLDTFAGESGRRVRHCASGAQSLPCERRESRRRTEEKREEA
jgi:hypothetical protein